MASSPKCPSCGKAVYFTEQQAYMGGFWHKACFKCDICKKALVGGSYVDHAGKPHCQSCYNKHHRPKGFGHGATTVDSHQYAKGPAAADTTASAAAPAAAAASSGGKFCSNCGKEKGTGKFCGNCGKAN